MHKIVKSETIELEIAAQVKFGDIEILRGRYITGIEFFKVGEVPKTPNQNDVVDDTAFASAFLELRQRGNAIPVSNLPLATLNRPRNDGRFTGFNPTVYDWVNSKVICTDTAAIGSNAGKFFLCVVYYQDSNLGGKEPRC